MKEVAALTQKGNLFDRRYYAIDKILTDLYDLKNEEATPDSIMPPRIAMFKERFLFSPQVFSEIEKAYFLCEKLLYAKKKYERSEGAEKNLRLNDIHQAHKEYDDFMELFYEKIAPDMAIYEHKIVSKTSFIISNFYKKDEHCKKEINRSLRPIVNISDIPGKNVG